MKRAILLLIVWAVALFCAPCLSLAAEEKAAGGEVAAHAEEGGAGELVPISEKAQQQAFVQAVWVIVIFVILLVILYPTAWKGVLHGLRTREERIRKDIADAEAAHQKAQETLAEYNKQLATAEDRVRELLAKAQVDGERVANTIRESAGKEAEAIKTKALADIEGAKKDAVSVIHAEAANLATAVAEKIIRRNLNVDDQRDLVKASLDELQQGRRN